MKGRKPVPTALKILRGNPGKQRLNDREPQPPPLDPAPPPELVDREAAAEWTRTIVPAIAAGLVTVTDRTLAIAHCELWATWRSQLAEAAEEPHVVEVGPRHYPTPNPLRSMANRTWGLLKATDAELGFSPTARARVQVARPDGAPARSSRFFGRRA